MSVNDIVWKIKTTAPSFSKFITICELKIAISSFSSQIVTIKQILSVMLEDLIIE